MRLDVFGRATKARPVTLCWIAALVLALVTLGCCLNRFTTARTLSERPSPAGAMASPESCHRSFCVWLRFGELPAETRVRLRVRAALPGPPDDLSRRALLLVPIDAAGRRDWDEDSVIARLHPTGDIREYRSDAFVEPDFRGFELVTLESARSGGRAEILGAELDVLAVRPFYRRIEPVLVVLWLALGGMFVALSVRAAVQRGYALAAVMVGVIFYAGTLMPARYVHIGSLVAKHGAAAIADELVGFGPAAVAHPHGSIPSDLSWAIEPEKLAHLSLSALLAVLARRGFAGGGLMLPASLLAIVAGTELLQMMTLDRDPSFADIGIDALGLLLGLAAARLLDARFRPRPP